MAYGEAQQGANSPVADTLSDLRKGQELARYIEHQMNTASRSYNLEQSPGSVLGIIRAGILEPVQMLSAVCANIEEGLQRIDVVTPDFERGLLGSTADSLRAFVEKIVLIGNKIIESRTEPVRLETEYVRALEDIRKKHLNVVYTRSGKLKCTVHCNRGAVYLLFRELISNSFKYRSEQKALFLTTRDESSEGHAVVHLIDNGIGMRSEDCRSRIFEVGTRLDDAIALGQKRASSSGRGLGLSIVKSIVNSMAGKIEVNSIPNDGTEFIVSFPRVQNAA